MTPNMEQQKDNKERRFWSRLFSDKAWWLGVLSNVLATVIGIALTIGVTYYSEIRHDREQGRIIMFKVIEKLKADSVAANHKMESIDGQLKACEGLLAIYKENGKSMQGVADSVIKKYMNVIGNYQFSGLNGSLEMYFYDPNVVRQIGNQALYTVFSLAIQVDKKCVEEMERLNSIQWNVLQQAVKKSGAEDKNIQQTAEELIREGFVPDYYANLYMSLLKGYKDFYGATIPQLLKEMKSSEKEYLEFQNSQWEEQDSFEISTHHEMRKEE